VKKNWENTTAFSTVNGLLKLVINSTNFQTGYVSVWPKSMHFAAGRDIPPEIQSRSMRQRTCLQISFLFHRKPNGRRP
jgi:hypothetical protein